MFATEKVKDLKECLNQIFSITHFGRDTEQVFGRVKCKWNGEKTEIELLTKTEIDFGRSFEKFIEDYPQISDLLQTQDFILGLAPVYDLDTSTFEEAKNFKDTDIEDKEIIQSYVVDGVDKKGVKIKGICGRTTNSIVYVEENGNINWAFIPKLPTWLRPAIIESGELCATARTSMSKVEYERTVVHIGSALASSFQLDEKADITKPFKYVRDLIQKKSEESLRLSYITSGLGFWFIFFSLMVFCLFAFGFNFSLSVINDLIIGSLAGSLGALVSIIQRGKNLKFAQFVSSKFVFFGGMIRICLGMILGILALVLIRSEFFFPNLTENNFYLTFSICVIAGISERFIPDLLEKFESNGQSENADVKAGVKLGGSV